MLLGEVGLWPKRRVAGKTFSSERKDVGTCSTLALRRPTVPSGKGLTVPHWLMRTLADKSSIPE